VRDYLGLLKFVILFVIASYWSFKSSCSLLARKFSTSFRDFFFLIENSLLESRLIFESVLKSAAVKGMDSTIYKGLIIV